MEWYSRSSHTELVGWTHEQQVSHKVGIIQGQNHLCHLVSLCTVIQAQEHLKVAVKMSHLDKKLTNQNLGGYSRVSPASYLNTC